MGGHDVTVKLVWMMQADTAVTEYEILFPIGNISTYFSHNLMYNTDNTQKSFMVKMKLIKNTPLNQI